MIPIDSKEYRLLYTDEFGDDVGLDEVQLLDPPLEDRVPELLGLLDSSDTFVSYQAMLVLSAWGNESGVKFLDSLVDEEKIHESGFESHRITDEDNVYDELAYAIYLYSLSDGDEDKIISILKKLLSIYPKYFFESKLKYVLLKTNYIELADLIENVIQSTLSNQKPYQASQLLPVLARFDAQKGWSAIQSFINLPPSIPDPANNIAESLKYCSSQDAEKLLLKYMSSNSPGVAEEASLSLKYMKS